MYITYLVLTALVLISGAECAKILGIFAAAAYSHNIIGARLMKELAARGHEVTFISPYPQKTPLKNLRDIELTGFIERMEEMRKERNMFDIVGASPLLMLLFMGKFGADMTENTLKHENVQKLLNSNETFDLVIKEQFLDEALHGLAHHFNAPLMIMCTIGPSAWTNRLIGNPAPPSYVPDVLLNYSTNMTFLQRTWNTIMVTYHELFTTLYSFYVHNNILHKYFPTAPHLTDLLHNTSFVLLNSHNSFGAAVPSVPNMAQVGGFHVEPPKKLPEHLQKFLDDAEEGVIYFSLGSNLKSKDMPIQKRDSILKAFSRLKLKVLWKWEDDELPGQPSNVKIEKWLPQQDILAHPNIKVFITHGGLLSTIEAIYHAVPVIGIPFFGDQQMNMANAERNGYALILPFASITEQSLAQALNEIIGNPKYKENVKMRSQLFHDQPMKPIDTAVYWVEYVIKHKGAPHLKSAGLHLSWYQYLLIDVIAFLVLVSFVTLGIGYIALKKLLCRKKKPKQKAN